MPLDSAIWFVLQLCGTKPCRERIPDKRSRLLADDIIKGILPSAVTSLQVTWHLCFQFHGRCHQIIKDNTKRVESQKYGQPIKSFFSFDFFGNNHGLRVIKKQLNETR